MSRAVLGLLIAVFLFGFRVPPAWASVEECRADVDVSEAIVDLHEQQFEFVVENTDDEPIVWLALYSPHFEMLFSEVAADGWHTTILGDAVFFEQGSVAVGEQLHVGATVSVPAHLEGLLGEWVVEASGDVMAHESVNCQGALGMRVVSDGSDQVGPVFSDLTVERGDDLLVVFEWETNELATSEVRYATLSGSLDPWIVMDDALEDVHSLQVSEYIDVDQVYYYQLCGEDYFGNRSCTDEAAFVLGEPGEPVVVPTPTLQPTVMPTPTVVPTQEPDLSGDPWVGVVAKHRSLFDRMRLLLRQSFGR